MKAQSGPLLPGAQAATNRGLCLRRLNVQTVLVLAFVLTAGTWLFAGSFFAKRIQEIEG